MRRLPYLIAATVCAALPIGAVDAQPAPTVPRSCASGIERAARWFVRELDAGAVSPVTGPGWRAWRGTTVDDGHVVPVLWVQIEDIPPDSRSAGAVSGWLEIDGPPPGMATEPVGADSPVVLPETHFARSTGRHRLVRALVDGTPKEQAGVIKALDKCAALLARPTRGARR